MKNLVLKLSFASCLLLASLTPSFAGRLPPKCAYVGAQVVCGAQLGF